MTEEQKKAKERTEKFMIYLYKKYYPQIEAEMKKREEMPKGISSCFLLKWVFQSFPTWDIMK